MRKLYFFWSSRIWGRGSTAPTAVVPSVATTVPMLFGLEGLLERGHIHAAGVVGGDLGERQAEDAADAGVGVVGLIGGGDAVAGESLARDPESFKVGEGSAGGEMAEVLGEAEHLCELGYGFELHGGAGAASVEGVVVGVDRHGERIGSARDGVRRLEHLAGVERVGVGVVVVQARGGLVEDGGCVGAERWCGCGAGDRRSLRRADAGRG